jgi:hypothetical protein
MTAKTSRASVARQTVTETSLTPLNLFTELPRRQLALMAQSASAMYRCSEDLRRLQQEAADRATEHYEEAVDRLRGDCDYSELMSVQAEMLRFNFQEAAQYWQQLAAAGMKMQAEMVSSTREVALEGGAEPTLDSLQRFFAATLNGSGTAAVTH